MAPPNYRLKLTVPRAPLEGPQLSRHVRWAFPRSGEIVISKSRFRVTLLSIVIVVAGSGCAMDAAMNDLFNNKYLTKKPYDNPNAVYVGTWSANVPGTILCYRIYPDGTAKYCQNKWNGQTEKGYAKVYKDTDDVFIISEPGAIFKIEAYSKDSIRMIAYGKQYEFIPGVKSFACEEFLNN